MPLSQTASDEQPLFEVSHEVFSKFPDYVVECLVVRNMRQDQGKEAVASIVDDALMRALNTYDGMDPKTIPAIATWREAFSTAGWSASRFPSSVEALLKRTLKSRALPAINPIVDLANAVSLTYLVPIGVHDIESLCNGSLVVRLTADEDQYLPLSSEPAETPNGSEIIYASGSDVRTRRWVWRQSKTALTSIEARDVLIPIDGFAGSTDSQIDAAAHYLADCCQQIFNADVTRDKVCQDQPSFDD